MKTLTYRFFQKISVVTAAFLFFSSAPFADFCDGPNYCRTNGYGEAYCNYNPQYCSNANYNYGYNNQYNNNYNNDLNNAIIGVAIPLMVWGMMENSRHHNRDHHRGNWNGRHR